METVDGVGQSWLRKYSKSVASAIEVFDLPSLLAVQDGRRDNDTFNVTEILDAKRLLPDQATGSGDHPPVSPDNTPKNEEKQLGSNEILFRSIPTQILQ
jgi:hypothetical protein